MIRKIGFCLMVVLGSIFTTIKAQETEDMQLLKYNNPGLTVDLGVGLWAWPIPIDYDGDGDMDLLVSSQGKPFNGLYLFENKSGDKTPVFEKPIWLAKHIKDMQVSFIDGKPCYTIPGAELLDIKSNILKNRRPLYPADSIKKDIVGRIRFNQWKMVDYDNDGDIDIVVGIDDWGDYGWDNAFNKEGKWEKGPLHGYVYLIENVKGEYVNKGRIKAGGKQIDVYGAPTPNFADFDGDGDLDLICGEFLDKLTYFENVGTREKPVYAEGRLLSNASGIIKMDLEMIIPVSIDWNKDGYVDLIVGDEDGRVALIENTGRVENGMPLFKDPFYLQQKADNVKFGALATPFSVDWDNDGDEDIIVGNSAGYIAFIENLGMINNMPSWAAPKLLKSDGDVIRVIAGYNGSIQGPAEEKWGYTTLSVADWDGDGLKDIIVNSIFGKIIWYKNIGTKTQPKLAKEQNVTVDWAGAAPKPHWNWWNPEPKSLVTQWRTTPYAIDWNKDGLIDLVMLDTGGYLSYFQRIKKGNELILKEPQKIFYATDVAGFNQKHLVTDSVPGYLQLNTGKYGQSGRRKFTIADWDRDGKLDILVNSLNVTMLKNMGTKKGLVQLKNNEPIAKLVLAGHDTSPTVVDWNKDGIPDLLVGAEDGHFYYYVNPKAKKK